MVTIPLICFRPDRIGLLDRLATWLHRGAAAQSAPARQDSPPPGRPAFLEHAAMSRELYRL
jgi:hypothetical protein